MGISALVNVNVYADVFPRTVARNMRCPCKCERMWPNVGVMYYSKKCSQGLQGTAIINNMSYVDWYLWNATPNK